MRNVLITAMIVAVSAVGCTDFPERLKAAELGDAEAQWTLGGYYLEGKGTKKDEAKAVEWFTKSAEQGNAEGQLALGACYLIGIGVEKDHAKAAEWMQKALVQFYEMLQEDDPRLARGLAGLIATFRIAGADQDRDMVKKLLGKNDE